MRPPNILGGTFESGKWITRTLNTFPSKHNFCTVTNNQFILNPGIYNVIIQGSVYGVLGHKMRLQNITDNYTETYSTNGYADSGDVAIIESFLELSEETRYEVQHICQKTIDDVGFGKPVGFNEPEIYCKVTIHNTKM
jgi:hypothetical protein